MSWAIICRERFPDSRIAHAKARRWVQAWRVPGTATRPVQLERVSEGEESETLLGPKLVVRVSSSLSKAVGATGGF